MQHALLITRDRLLAEKQTINAKLSDACRYIAFGCLIAYYVLMSGDGDFASRFRHGFGVWAVHNIGLFGTLAILCDHLQYFCGSKSVQSALDEECV